MGKFYGKIGYSKSVETTPGVWTNEIIERNYSGDVGRQSRKWESGENLNDDLTINNVISILADPFAYQNSYAMKYIIWNGGYWMITKLDINHPRIVLSIGGVYNGDKA